MTKKTELPQPAAGTAVAKIEELIRQKRAPFEARQNHLAELDADIIGLESAVDEYLANPTTKAFHNVRTAEEKLVAARSLRLRLGQLNIDAALEPVLNQAFEAAPFFTELADANMAFLSQCRERAREFRVALAASETPNRLLDGQISIYGQEISEAEKGTAGARAWIRAWARGQYDPQYWNFWSIYRSLKTMKVRLYADTSEMPIPPNYCPDPPPFNLGARVAEAGRALIPNHEPEEGGGVLSGEPAFNQ
jgi:hypothetical protein